MKVRMCQTKYQKHHIVSKKMFLLKKQIHANIDLEIFVLM